MGRGQSTQQATSPRTRASRKDVTSELDLPGAMKLFRAAHPRASNRQAAIQAYCAQELKKRGIEGVTLEAPIEGQYRTHKWDVGLVVNKVPLLGISCKSIVSNHGGTVPNRVDDMLGEAANVHRKYPGAVLGYLTMISRVDESQRTQKQTEKLGGLTPERLDALREEGDRWFEKLAVSLDSAAGRKTAEDAVEKFEVVTCSQVDFTVEPFDVRLSKNSRSPEQFFDQITALYKKRHG